MNKIYFDHNATTPVIDEVFDAMVPFLKEQWGNPSSIHWAGRGTRKAVEDAREKVCALLNCAPLELIFTSSGTEGASASATAANLRSALSSMRPQVRST